MTGSTTLSHASLYEAEQKKLQEKMDNYAVYNHAADALDISACDKITNNDALKIECLDNVYSAMASKQKNVALCDKIQDTQTKSRCVSTFAYDAALASGKQSDCDKILSDSDLKNACLKNVVFTRIESQSFTGTTSICGTLSGADKDYCTNRIQKSADIDLLQRGTSTKDITICAKIQDTSMRNTCSDTVYMTLAMEKKDGSICAQIIDTPRRASCNTQFTKIADALFLQSAITQNNLTLCTKITNSDLRVKCSDNILLKQAITNKDLNTCTQIHDRSVQEQCNSTVKLVQKQ